ncbi:3D domain-containing protein [uncultured Clostridium sp.]|uniref:3D domain-containing protein n=1 Tax=uncultured Clostridium sp. TaxID=59620 RepID=UPI0025D5473A|nr:3D domain-containing protein [uncultured Clostridium sp.]
MVERLKRFTTKSLFNGPKAKIILGAVATTLTIATIATITVMNMRKTLTISIDGKEETFVTYKGTVQDVLQERNIAVGVKDKVQPSLESRVSEKETIKIKSAIPVEITANGVRLEVQSAEDTIGEMLENEKSTLQENGIEFNNSIDEVLPDANCQIEDNLSVQIINVEKKELVQNEPINFETIVEKDENLDKSVSKVKSEGVNGEKEVTYEVVYKDGVETSRNITSTKTIVEPQNEIVLKGTGQVYASRGGESINYKEKLNCVATAYSGDKTTATGKAPVRNPGGISTIAVDPSFIPLGSKVYVEGYGYAIASDTGGAIKGNIIDLFLNSSSECKTWGRRPVTVLIVAYPGEW